MNITDIQKACRHSDGLKGWGEEEVARLPLDGFKDHSTRKTHVGPYTLLLNCGAGEDS